MSTTFLSDGLVKELRKDKFNMIKRIFTVSVVVLTIFWAVGLAAFVPVAQAAIASGDLIKASGAAVYYYGADGKRYVFPDQKTYMTWYPDFSGVKTITDAELAAIQIGGNVTYRPGVKLIKITTDPKVYAVGSNGTLRWVTTEAIAICLYGATWGSMVQDVPDPFFVNYTIGGQIDNCSDFIPATVTAAASSINVDKGLAGGTAVGELTVSLASDTPANQTVPEGATGVVASVINLAAASNDITLNALTIKRSNLGAPAEISKIYLYEGVNKLTTGKTLNVSTNEAQFVNLNKVIKANTTLKLSVVVDINPAAATDGMHQFGVLNASSVSSSAASVGGLFPVNGNIVTLSSVTVGGVDVESTGVVGVSTYTRKVGETGVEIGNFSVTVNNTEDASFTGITLYNSGRDVISNLKLYRGSDLVSTATQSGSYFVFILPTPYSIDKSTSASFTVKGDIGGRNADTAVLDVRYNTDIKVKGKTYGYNLTVMGGLGSNATNSYSEEAASAVGGAGQPDTTTVQAGQLTAAINGPSAGSVSKNTNDVVLMNFKLTAASNLDVEKATVLLAGNANLLATDIQNLEVVCGNQIMVSTAAPVIGNNVFTDVWQLTGGKVTDCLVRVDITNTAAGDETIQATLVDLKAGPGTNWKFKDSGTGDTINDIVPSGNIAGNIQTVIAASLSIQLGANPASGTVYVKGATDVSTAGFVFTAGSAADVKINSVKLTAYLDDNTGGFAAGDMNQLSGAGDVMSAVKIYDSANLTTPLATAKSLTVGTADITVTFDSLNWIIAKGASKTLLVKVDLSTTAPKSGNNDNFAIAIAAAGSVAAEYGSGSTLTPSLVNGNTTPSIFQTVTTAGKLTMQTDSSTPLTTLVAMSTSNVTFTKVKFNATKEAFTVNKLRVYNSVAGTDDNFALITLSYLDKAGATQTATQTLSGQYADFSGLTIYVPVGVGSVITIKANMNSLDDGADNADAPVLKVIQNGKFEAAGASSGTTYVTSVFAGDSDAGAALTVATNLDITGGDATWAAGECIYIAAGAAVAAADVRVTDCGSYYAGSAVDAADLDVGTVVTQATNLEITGGDATWTAPEAAYIDADASNTASLDDSRVLFAVTGNNMKVYESYPTVAIPQNVPASDKIVQSVSTLIGRIDITAGANKNIVFKNGLGNQIVIQISDPAGNLGNITLKDSGGTQYCSGAIVANAYTCAFTAGDFDISAGATGQLFVYADTSGMLAGESCQMWLDDGADANMDWSIAGVGSYEEGTKVFKGDKYGIPMAVPN